MSNIFTKHLVTVGESYFEHGWVALRFGSCMILGGLILMIHAIFPFLFQKTATGILFNLTTNCIERCDSKEPKIQKLKQALDKKLKE